MLKILMGPNVKILMGQSFGSWTHGHGRGPRRRVGGGGGAAAARRPGGGGPCAQGHGPMPMCPGAKALAHEYFDIWAHKYF